MWREHFAHHALAPLGVVAMGIFFSVFVVVVFRVLSKRAEESGALAAMPLHDDEVVAAPGAGRSAPDARARRRAR